MNLLLKGLNIEFFLEGAYKLKHNDGTTRWITKKNKLNNLRDSFC